MFFQTVATLAGFPRSRIKEELGEDPEKVGYTGYSLKCITATS
jgi:hypothetical protein